MKRFEPKTVANHGLIGFHIQVGIRTSIWKMETVGAAGQWDSESLDKLASMTAYLTLNDNPNMTPLPLWYAEQLVKMPREVLSELSSFDPGHASRSRRGPGVARGCRHHG